METCSEIGAARPIISKGKGKGSWICIAPHCEKLASEAVRYGSHGCYTANNTITGRSRGTVDGVRMSQWDRSARQSSDAQAVS